MLWNAVKFLAIITSFSCYLFIVTYSWIKIILPKYCTDVAQRVFGEYHITFRVKPETRNAQDIVEMRHQLNLKIELVKTKKTRQLLATFWNSTPYGKRCCDKNRASPKLHMSKRTSRHPGVGTYYVLAKATCSFSSPSMNAKNQQQFLDSHLGYEYSNRSFLLPTTFPKLP